MLHQFNFGICSLRLPLDLCEICIGRGTSCTSLVYLYDMWCLGLFLCGRAKHDFQTFAFLGLPGLRLLRSWTWTGSNDRPHIPLQPANHHNLQITGKDLQSSHSNHPKFLSVSLEKPLNLANMQNWSYLLEGHFQSAICYWNYCLCSTIGCGLVLLFVVSSCYILPEDDHRKRFII